jgi:transcriptional regulator with XRE-family HTH domain
MAVFPKRLKALRKEARLTFADMSYLLNCEEEYYQKVEAGASDLPFSKVILLSKCFSVSLDYLAGNTGTQKT